MSADPSAARATAEPSRPPLPTGTVTFLFTDIEGSTRILQDLGPERYAGVLTEHDRLLEAVIGQHGGRVFGHEGDAVFAAFEDALSAVEAALAAQRAIRAEKWPPGASVRVRMALHTGEPVTTEIGYVGLPLHQVARIVSIGHGGQILVSASCRSLVADRLAGGIELRDLGPYRLKDLARTEHLYELVAPDQPAHPLPPRSVQARPNNLPLQLTSFVGRAEIESARGLLQGSRLLTLSGPGGTGKTRLALELADEVMDQFPDGTFFVALDAVDDPDLVPSAIAHALGLELGVEPPLERLARELRDKRTLLVLDNFEQVVGAAPAVSRLLREAPELKVIVTSRVVLRTYGEQEFSVPPLSEEEAVRLFVDRASAASASFRLNGNLPVVEEIVTRLDRLPLAIELAAARVRLLPVTTLRSRLDQRLAVLTGGPRDLPARQQTLRGAIDWSYDLLADPDRRLFERFSVFAGGADLAQIEVVCGPPAELGQEVLDGLASLVDKSLLRSIPGLGDDPRFAMLATIREYAIERLAARGETRQIRERHARVYLLVAESCAPRLTGQGAADELDRLAVDHDNIRAAIDWAIEAGEAELAHRFAAALWRFWQVRGHLPEATDRLGRILAMPGADALPAAVRSRAHGAAGSTAYWSGDFDATAEHYRTALSLAREAGDPVLLAEATYNAGFEPLPEAEGRRRFSGGKTLFEEARRLYLGIGDERGAANATWALAIAELSLDEYPAARQHFENSLELYRRLGEPFGEGWALHMIGLMDVAAGDADAADRRFREALRIFQRTNDLSAVVLLLQDFALVARLRGEDERSWSLGGASDALSRKTGTGLAGNVDDFIPVAIPTQPAGDPEAERAWAAGLAMSTEDAIALALSERAPARGAQDSP